MKKKIIVVGAGFGGLSAAALLAKEGYKVHVVEKNSLPGGRAQILKAKGFQFDMGPSWYLMPDVFERFYKEFNKDPKRELRLVRLDPQYRMFFGKNDVVNISAKVKENVKLFESLEAGGGKRFLEYLSKSEMLYSAGMHHFVYPEINNFKDFLKPEIAKMKGFSLGLLYKNVDSYISTYLNNDKARKILEYTMVFLGGSPKKTPALYSIMSHVDFNLGVWYPMGGMWSVVQSLVSICEENGVVFSFNNPVKEVITEGNIVVGIKTRKGMMTADSYVMNADYHHVETELLKQSDRTYKSKYWEKRTVAPSAFIIFLGLNKKIKNLTHHNLLNSNDWEGHFDSIFSHPSWPKNPSYYVSCPSKIDSSVAPKNSENLFILVPVAAGLKDNEKTRNDFCDMILANLEETLGEEIKKNIVYKKIFSHTDFTQEYNSFKGTALGLSHTLMQTAFLRPNHKSKKLKNLYFTGQYTQPGIGVPMVLVSSMQVRDLIKNDDHSI